MKSLYCLLSLVTILPVRAAELWDMADVRTHSLAVEAIGTPRSVPFATPGASDWLNTADSWVAPAKSASTAGATDAPTDDGRLLVEEMYFNLVTTPAGPSRIYCAIARPEKAAGRVPVVVIFHGGGGHASPALALAAARRHPGMAGVAMDYNGQFAARKAERVTEWKIPAPTQRLALVPDLRNYPLYHYVTAARRTLDWLETTPWADASRFGVNGVSYGGWVALILAGVDPRVKCVTTGVSAGGVGDTPGKAAQQLRWEPSEQRPLWLSHYEPLAYAPSTHAGVFLQLASNDYWFWITGAARQLAALPGPKGWVVRPNSNHGAGGPELSDLAAPAFMRHLLLGTPALSSVEGFAADRAHAVYAWQVNGSQPVRRTSLYWSPGRVPASARYWLEFPGEKSDGGWTAVVPREFAGLAALTFVNVLTADGVAITGPLLEVEGIDPRLGEVSPLWPGEAIWDRARGAAAWRMPGGWFSKTEIAATVAGGVSFRPDGDGREFCAITNSVVLANGRAVTSRGLTLRVNAGAEGGVVSLGLVRNSMNLDETAWKAEVRYEKGGSSVDVPWAQFKPDSPAAGPKPWPFDALRIEGKREDRSALAVEAINLVPASDPR